MFGTALACIVASVTLIKSDELAPATEPAPAKA
jgi:hypothetical protein